MDLKIHEYPLERLSFGDNDFYDIDFWDGFEYKTAKILGSVIKDGILSGIAISLTAPSAFIVGGSPVDGNGTLTLTGAGLANQYIRGDGTLATFPTSGGGGNSVNYYLNGGTASSVATYFQMSKVAVIGTGVDFSRDGNGLISQWLTDINEPNVTEIPAGNWNFEMFFSASSAGGVPKFYIEILKYNGTTFTTIANNSAVPEAITSGTTIDLYLTSVAVPLTPLLVTDRIAIRVYIVDSTAGRTIIHHTQNSHLCQIITSFSSGLSSINGLTKQTQYLAVGTAGSDFAINSATDTHTFNLPTASASRRGALSSADWTIFNNKQDLLVSASNIKTINGTSILGSGNIVLPNKLNLLIDVAQPPIANGYLRWNDSTEFWETNQLDFKTINSQSIIGSGNLEISAPSGKFGISNSSGVYTYYATLTLAMASAVSGQVIEMFADVIETGNVTITLKNGVNINGNGHTYILNSTTATNAIIDNGIAVNSNIFNITFKSINTTGTTYVLRITGASKINGNNSTNFYSDTKYGVGINNANADVSGIFGSGLRGIELSLGLLSNSSGEALSLSGSMGILIAPSAKGINCFGKALGSGTAGIYNEGSLFDSTAYATLCIAIHGGGIVYNCVAYSSGSIAIVGNIVTNSTGYSSASNAIQGGTIINSSGYSTAGIGIQIASGTIQNSVGYSTSSNGISMIASGGGGSFCWNSFAYSQASSAISQTNNNTTFGTSQISNCTIVCFWDSVNGHAINASGITNIANCSMRVSNVSAKAIFSASALTLKYANNTFEGSTAPISATITQGITNVLDTKGNILI